MQFVFVVFAKRPQREAPAPEFDSVPQTCGLVEIGPVDFANVEIDRSTVSNLMRLLELPDQVLDDLLGR